MGGRIAVGFFISAVWAAVAAFYLRDTLLLLPNLSLHEFGGLMFARSLELAFFLLVLGYIWLATAYFQQRAVCMQHAELAHRASEEVAAVSRKLDAECSKFQSYREKRVRAAQPRWEMQSCIAHKDQHEITVRNTGAPASNIRAIWEPELAVVVALSSPSLVDRGEQLSLKIVFVGAPLDHFAVTLEYCDALRETRRADIAVSDAIVSIKHQDD